MTDYKLTPEQRKYLDSLVCQRVTDDKANKEIIKNFKNMVNNGIAGALRHCWNQDSQDKLAYYIIKDPELEMPLFFFSLKCGEIHVPMVPEKLDSASTSALMMLRANVEQYGKAILPDLPDPKGRDPWERREKAKYSLRRSREVEVEEWVTDIVEKQAADGGLTDEDWNHLWDRVFTALEKQHSYKKELELEGENIIRTKKSFPSVELEHFCAYDPIGLLPPYVPKSYAKAFKAEHNPVLKRWNQMGMGNQSLGTTVFWNFVEPKIREIRDLVGCQYLYLFAADEKKDGDLTNYYKKLGFDFRDDINVTKPAYDFQCFFMCQEVSSLRTRRNAFFREYNAPK